MGNIYAIRTFVMTTPTGRMFNWYIKVKMEKEIKRLKASRDYWKEKAEKLIKENEYYKKKAKEYELALRIEYSDRPALYKLFFN